MAERPTEENFSRHLNTKFQLRLETPEPVALELAEVNVYKDESGAQEGWERFTAVFHGPAEAFLPQHMYQLRHEAMGDLTLFLVPIGRDERGFRYEAVFNYQK